MKKIFLSLVICGVLVSGMAAGMVNKFMDACEGGDMQSCYQAGVTYQTGDGTFKSAEVAKLLFELACDGGVDDACAALQKLEQTKKGQPSAIFYRNKTDQMKFELWKKGSSHRGFIELFPDFLSMKDYAKDRILDSLLMETLIKKINIVEAEYSSGKISYLEAKEKLANFKVVSVNKKVQIPKKYNMETDITGVPTIDHKTYKNNCIKGNMESCYQVGSAYYGEYGPIIKHNLNLAKQFFDLSCEGGYYRACGALAAVYTTEKFRDYKKAEHFAKIACGKEKENGCMVLGRMYNNDDYLKRNKLLAKQYFSKALKYSLKNCSQSIGSACYDAAWLYDTDVLGVKDKAKAKQFYAKSCRLDSLDGYIAMAAYLEVSRDMKKAAELYRKVCERYGEMCGYLAVLYRYGNGNLEKDLVLAQKYFRKACNLGEKDACKEVRP